MWNLRANVNHELAEYDHSIAAAQKAEAISRTMGAAGQDLLGESLAWQGFAEAETGKFKESALHLKEANSLPLDESIRLSIRDYVNTFSLNEITFFQN